MASQAQTLLAVIAGSTRRKVNYWRESVLRSSLYGIPQSEDLQLNSNPLALVGLRLYSTDDSVVKSESIGLESITLRSSLVRYIDATVEHPTSTPLIVDNISLIVVSPLKEYYEPELEGPYITSVFTLDNITLKSALIRYFEPTLDVNATSNPLTLESIGLTTG